MSWRACVLVLAVGLAAYANLPSRSFVYDDVFLVGRNPSVARVQPARLFSQAMWEGTGIESRLYRPAHMTSLALERHLFGDDGRGYRWVSIAFHLAASAAVLALLGALGIARWPAAAGAAVFAAHPVHTEAVALATNRSEVVVALLYLLALLALSRFVLGGRRPALGYALAAACYGAGLLYRESMATLPFVAALLLWLRPAGQPRPRPLPALAGLALVAAPLAPYLAVRAWALGGGGAPLGLAAQLSTRPILERVAQIATPLRDYLRLLVAPVNLRADYQVDYVVASGAALVAAVAVSVALLGAGAGLSRARPRLAFAILFFYVTLLPSTQVFADPAILAERFLYLPSVGFAIAIAEAAGWLGRRASPRLVAIACAAVVVILGGATAYRNLAWRSNPMLWSVELEAAPESALARYNLAAIALEAEDYAVSEQLLEQALERKLNTKSVWINLGITRVRLGKVPGAAKAFRRALEQWPDDAQVLVNNTVFELQFGSAERALRLAERATQVAPRFGEAHMVHAQALGKLGRGAQAMAAFRRAADLDPDIDRRVSAVLSGLPPR